MVRLKTRRSGPMYVINRPTLRISMSWLSAVSKKNMLKKNLN